MDITWLGHGCFRLRGRTAAVVTDPYPPALGPKLAKLEADLVTISHEHENHSYRAAVARDPYVVTTPGEYEVAGVVVAGVPTFHDAQQGATHGRNTVFVIEVDDVRVCHLGDLGHRLGDETIEQLGSIDVLLVPVGGGASLDGNLAAEVARQVDARYVVPMHFGVAGIRKELEPVERFLREMGVVQPEPVAKLAVQASTAGEADTRVVVLEPRL